MSGRRRRDMISRHCEVLVRFGRLFRHRRFGPAPMSYPAAILEGVSTTTRKDQHGENQGTPIGCVDWHAAVCASVCSGPAVAVDRMDSSLPRLGAHQPGRACAPRLRGMEGVVATSPPSRAGCVGFGPEFGV